MIPKIALKVTARNYAGLVNLGNGVLASLTGALPFPTPSPALSVLQTDITAVVNAIAAWGPKGNRGSHANIVALREASLTLHQTLKALADYVQTTASITAGNDFAAMATLITSSGFKLAATPAPVGVLEVVQNFHNFFSRSVNKNQVKLKWKRPLNTNYPNDVKNYTVYRSATAVFNTAIPVANTPKTSFLDTNTSTSAQTWFYWIVPSNAFGPGIVSDAVAATLLSA